ncbi:MAG TPA: MarR family winged helix-turn-helix transcriptional regulator [Pseudonocardiaceae bacterium]|jgi:DNA-binding MarR family transcriptional regulator|nr:MarR family winged helix-turn-helix transcriptional regulator [Pseudonocardiaceae bacterium]
MANPRWLTDAQFRAWIGYRRMRLLLDAEVTRDLTRESGLSAPDYDVLSALMDAPERRARVTELARRMLWSKSRLSRHLGRMRERGLVERIEDTGEGRHADVVLTEAGERAIVEAAPGHVESVRRHFIDLLTDEQLRVFGDVADTVLSQLPPTASDAERD